MKVGATMPTSSSGDSDSWALSFPVIDRERCASIRFSPCGVLVCGASARLSLGQLFGGGSFQPTHCGVLVAIRATTAVDLRQFAHQALLPSLSKRSGACGGCSGGFCGCGSCDDGWSWVVGAVSPFGASVL